MKFIYAILCLTFSCFVGLHAQVPPGFSWQTVETLDFGDGTNHISIKSSSAGLGGEAELRLDTADGEIIGRIFFHQTGSADYFLEYGCDLDSTLTGVHQVYINYLDYEEPFLTEDLEIGEIALSSVGNVNNDPEGNLHIYPPVPGLDPSPYYEIRIQKVSQLNSSDLTMVTNWESPFAWFTQCKDESANNEGYYAGYIGGWSHTYANFELDPNTPIAIKITRKGDAGDTAPFGDIMQAVAHPEHRIESLELIDGEVYITMDQSGLFAIDIDGQMDTRISPRALPEGFGDDAFPYKNRADGAHSISIFANPFIENKPDSTDADVLVIKAGEIFPTDINSLSWNTLYFEPGVHKLSVDDINGVLVERLWDSLDMVTLEDDKTYYIPGDAIVYGNFTDFKRSNSSSNNIRVFGHGTISGEKILHYKSYPGFPNNEYPFSEYHRSLLIRDAQNCHYEGITISDPANHSLTFEASGSDIYEANSIRWAKVIGWRENSDATSTSGHTIIEDCFFRTQDDGHYVGGAKPLRRTVFWHDVNGQTFRNSFASRIFDENKAANIPDVILIEDIDVIYARGVFSFPADGGYGLIAVDDGVQNETLAGGLENTGQMIVLKDIRISDPLPTRHLFSFDGNTKVGDYAGMRFINIDYKGPQVFKSPTDPIWRDWLAGGATSDLRNMVLQNITIEGEKMDLNYVNDTSLCITEYTSNFTFRSSDTISSTNHVLTKTATNGSIQVDQYTGIPGQIELTVLPNEGYIFDSWSGDTTGNSDTLLLTMDSDKTIVANFKNITYSLTTTALNGSIAVEPEGDFFIRGTEVTLVAAGDLGYVFDSWSGDTTGTNNSITVVMDSDKDIIANFTSVPTFEIIKNESNGEIILDPPGPIYNVGSVVNVFAVADFEYSFGGWIDSLSGIVNPTSIVVDTTKTIGANFDFIGGGIPSLSVNSGGGSYTTAEGKEFITDTGFNGGLTFGTGATISGTNDQNLYQTERYGELTYIFDLPNGVYDITFKFAEIFEENANFRVFNVLLEDEEVISNLDIWAEVGKNAAYDETHQVLIEDGQLNIELVAINGNPKISAIEISIGQTITFPEIPLKYLTDPDFNPNAVASSELPVTLISSDLSVATIVNSSIQTVGEGIATITASQVGNIYFSPAEEVSQQLTVLAAECAYVTNTNDTGAGSLRDAIACVADGGVVILSPDLKNDTITLTSNSLLFDKNLSIISSEKNIYLMNNSPQDTIEVSQDTEVDLINFNILSPSFLNRGSLYCTTMTFRNTDANQEINFVTVGGGIFVVEGEVFVE